MKLLIDMNLSPAWVGALTAAGFDAVHWSMVGAMDASDHEIMAYAGQHGFVVMTNDLDFSAILAASQEAGPSVVQIRGDDLSVAALSAKVMAALEAMRTELAAGALLTVDTKRSRLRLLPLKRPE